MNAKTEAIAAFGKLDMTFTILMMNHPATRTINGNCPFPGAASEAHRTRGVEPGV